MAHAGGEAGGWRLQYLPCVSDLHNALKARLEQKRFEDPEQTAFLTILVLANRINRLLDEACAPHGITHAQYNVLRVLRGAGQAGLARKQIAGRLIERAPDTTRFLDRLQRDGYVKRGRSSRDGRLSVAMITPSGLAVLAAADPAVMAVRHRLLGAVARSDLGTATRILLEVLGREA